MLDWFLTWESLCVLNIILTASFPFLFWKTKNDQHARLVILLLAPFILSFLAWTLGPKIDLPFFFSLVFLHLSVSTLNLYLLWHFVQPQKYAITLYYAVTIFSLCISLLGFIASPTMKIVDPFWGVLPGTIFLDPIISRSPYVIRFVVSLLTWFGIFIFPPFRRLVTMTFNLIFFGILFIYGQIGPSSWMTVRTLEDHFSERATLNRIRVFIEDPHSQDFSVDTWAREFQYHWENILGKSPPPISKESLKIFIFKDSSSKAHWIGARDVQIGDFLRGEMHLSEESPDSPLIAHELAHLIHGLFDDAPAISFLDPFLFEGWAVAASSGDPQRLKNRAAALLQIQEHAIESWPRYFQFLNVNPSVAYTLAGAAATEAISNQKMPWDFPLAEIESMKRIQPDADSQVWAKNASSVPPLKADPLRRDCARAKAFGGNIKRYCRIDVTTEWFEYQDLLQRKDEILNKEKDPAFIRHLASRGPWNLRLQALERLEKLKASTPNEALEVDRLRFYRSLSKQGHDPIGTARNLLRKWQKSKSPQAKAFVRRLQWELNHFE